MTAPISRDVQPEQRPVAAPGIFAWIGRKIGLLQAAWNGQDPAAEHRRRVAADATNAYTRAHDAGFYITY